MDIIYLNKKNNLYDRRIHLFRERILPAHYIANCHNYPYTLPFGPVALEDAIVNLFDLVTPLWGKILRIWGLNIFAAVIAILFLIWFALGHPDLRREKHKK